MSSSSSLLSRPARAVLAMTASFLMVALAPRITPGVALGVDLRGAAHAATPEEEAALLMFRDGRKLFDAGQYQAALTRFEKAWNVVRNDFLRYYIGRTYKELGRCDDAIEYLSPLAGKVPAEAERERAAAEASCRLDRARKRMAQWACAAALDDLRALPPGGLGRKEQSAADAMTARAERCVEVFDTHTPAGQRAARSFDEARRAIEAGEAAKALDAAEDSLHARPSAPAKLVRAAALSQLDRCGEALPVLAELRGGLPEAAEGRRGRLETECMLREARRFVGADKCREAMPLLIALDGRVSRADERWRRTKANYCAPRATDFFTDSTESKAAYKLYLAAKKAQAAGNVDRALDLYSKALGFKEEPVVRHAAASLALREGRCPVVLGHLAKLPKTPKKLEDAAAREACSRYTSTVAAASPAGRATPVEGLRLRSEGDFRHAAKRLGAVDSGQGDLDLWLLRQEVRWAGDDCEGYLQGLGVAPAGGLARLPDGDARRAQCQTKVDASKPVVAIPAAPVEEGRDHTTLAWVAVGGGAALVAVAAGLGAGYAGQSSAMADAAKIYNTTPDEGAAAKAKRDYDDAASSARTLSGVAWAAGVLGVGAVGTGVYLLLTADESAPRGEGEVDVSLRPLLWPGGLGVSASF